MARRYAIRLSLPDVAANRRWFGRYGQFEPATAVQHMAAFVYLDEMEALAALPWALDLDKTAHVVVYPSREAERADLRSTLGLSGMMA